MANVTINGPATINGSFEYQGITFYGWTFSVTVDGQVGVYTVWVDTNDPAYESSAAQDAIDDLEADPGAEEGISSNDPGSDGDNQDGPGDDGDDDSDGVLAGNGGSEFGDSA